MNNLKLGLKKTKQEYLSELVLPVLLFATIGAFYWAIRGTGGYGGSSGATYAGIGWALAWFFLSYESDEKKTRPYSSGWVVLAITLGIGIGGMHGYGQFMSWIRGVFYVNGPEETMAINPAIGFLWLFQCGLAWGGTAGIFLAWCGSKTPTQKKDWIFRIIFGIAGGLVGYLIPTLFPGLINPLYDTVDYSDCADCARTLSTSQSSMALLGVFFGLLAYEIIRKEWRGVALTLTMAIGWGLAFSIFAFWHFGPQFSDLPLDWWKMWEMSIGFVGGATLGLCYYLYNRPFKKEKIELILQQPYSEYRNAEKILGVELTIAVALGWSIYNGIGGFVGKFGLENPWGLIISIPFIGICILYTIIMILRTRKKPYQQNDGRENISHPALRFIIVHGILVILGYMVSYSMEPTFGYIFRMWIYSILLIFDALVTVIRIKSEKLL